MYRSCRRVWISLHGLHSNRMCRRGTAGRTHPQPETCCGCFLPDLTGFTGSRTRADPAIPPRHIHRHLNDGSLPGQSNRALQSGPREVAGMGLPAGGGMAERVGFEPTEWQAIHLISNQARSTGLRHLSGRWRLAFIQGAVPRPTADELLTGPPLPLHPRVHSSRPAPGRVLACAPPRGWAWFGPPPRVEEEAFGTRRPDPGNR